MSITRKVRKSGNGHVVGVPIEIMNDLGVSNGTELEYVKQEDGNYIIKKIEDNAREKEIINLANEVFQQYDKTIKDLVQR